MTFDHSPMYTPSDIMLILCIKKSKCYEMLKRGQFPGAVMVGSSWRIPPAALELE